MAHRYRLTLVHGRHSTPTEVLLRLLVAQHLYAWSYQETVERVADSLVLRWFCRVYFHRVPDKATRLRWAYMIRPETLQALLACSAVLAQQARVTRARKLRVDSTCVQTPIPHPPSDRQRPVGRRCAGADPAVAPCTRRARPLVEDQLVEDQLAGVQEAFRLRLRATRLQGEKAAEQHRDLYQRLLGVTLQAVRQALPAVAHHQAVFGRPSWLVTGDRRLHIKGPEDQAHELGVTHIVIPRIGRLTATQRARERQRAWKRRYRWRAGIEGRIHSLRCDYGLARCCSHGEEGLQRDVGWGVPASNLRHMAQKQAIGAARRSSTSNRAA